jgi:uncharacterized protein YajQ (UPF0234 family)
MAKSSSFDVVSEIDFQEVDNAVNQAIKEIQQRYDLKASNTEVILNKPDKFITINSKDEYSLNTSFDIIQTKFLKRQLSLKSMKREDVEAASGGRLRQKITLQSGISKENGKVITKLWMSVLEFKGQNLMICKRLWLQSKMLIWIFLLSLLIINSTPF